MVTIKFNLAAAAENRKRSRSVDTYQGNEEDQDSVISDGSEAGDTSQALPAHALPPSVAAGRMSSLVCSVIIAEQRTQRPRNAAEADHARKLELKI